MIKHANLKKFVGSLKNEYDTNVKSITQNCKGSVCGPNVTDQVKAAVQMTRKAFKDWDDDQRRKAADALISFTTGLDAWDIVELHRQEWILAYRPDCATQGATPHCGGSIQVDKECYYAGSVNYVIYGVMFKLCYDHFSSRGTEVYIPNTWGFATAVPLRDSYTEAEMIDWIEYYKGSKAWEHLGDPADNVEFSKSWATAGYRGWPESGATPAGDRNNCKPCCSATYVGPPFSVHWHPYTISAQKVESSRTRRR